MACSKEQKEAAVRASVVREVYEVVPFDLAKLEGNAAEYWRRLVDAIEGLGLGGELWQYYQPGGNRYVVVGDDLTVVHVAMYDNNDVCCNVPFSRIIGLGPLEGRTLTWSDVKEVSHLAKFGRR